MTNVCFFLISLRNSFLTDFHRKQLTLSPDSEGASRYTKELEGITIGLSRVYSDRQLNSDSDHVCF